MSLKKFRRASLRDKIEKKEEIRQLTENNEKKEEEIKEEETDEPLAQKKSKVGDKNINKYG